MSLRLTNFTCIQMYNMYSYICHWKTRYIRFTSTTACQNNYTNYSLLANLTIPKGILSLFNLYITSISYIFVFNLYRFFFFFISKRIIHKCNIFLRLMLISNLLIWTSCSIFLNTPILNSRVSRILKRKAQIEYGTPQ